jgi:hypothetical protein
MSPLHHRLHPLLNIALLTAWIFQIFLALSLSSTKSTPFSPLLPATGPSWKISQEDQTLNPSSRYSQLLLSAQPGLDRESLPTLSEFASHVRDGRELAVRGVYVPDVLALPVVQQPLGNITYVSESLGTVTQFQLAALYNVIGLLAHNYLSGDLFSKLEIGQDVYAVMGNGTIHRFAITSIHKFQKIVPSNPNSSYIDLNTGKQLSMRQVFSRFYQGGHRIIFQTCLEKNGSLIWGLMFIQADPVQIPIITFNRGLYLR